jgi:Gas vesicle synthesis protein GvpL/GvpF
MPTHLYCLLPAGSDSTPPLADSLPPAERGGAAVRALRVGGIVAWVASTAESRLTREGRRAAAEAVRHDRVIARALARGVTPVPATLADPYPDDDALIAGIGGRTAEIVKSLDRVAGAVEMAVILAPRDSGGEIAETPVAAGGPGRQYLERRRDLPARLAAAADEIDERLRPIALDSSRRADKDRVGLSHLIRRADVDRYRAIAVAHLSERYRIVVDGPRAPYSFAAFSPRHTEAE